MTQRASEGHIINLKDILTCRDDYHIHFNMKLSYRVFILSTIVVSFLLVASAFAFEVKPMTLKDRCVVCHTAERICAKLGNGDDFWEPTVKRMASNGAKVPEQELAGFSLLLSGQEEVVAGILACSSFQKTGTMPSASKKISIYLVLIHPVFMTIAVLLSLWVAWQGINRARISHFKHTVRFDWKGHVNYGIIVMGAWFFGMIAGGVMAKLIYGATGLTGAHRTVALIMFPMIILGACTGLYMKYKKAPRKILPIVHGVNSLVLFVLACMQLLTGFYLVRGIF